MDASYLSLSENNLGKRVKKLREKLRSCDVCPRECGVNRLRGERGECGAGESIKISSAAPHFGQKSPQGDVGTGWRSKSGRKRDCSAGVVS